MSRIGRISVAVAAVFALCGGLQGGDWPHWRGPHYNGASDETNLPVSWSKQAGVAWVAPMPGPSAATPVVAGGRVYVSSTGSGEKELLAICLDAATGEVLWQRKLADGRKIRRHTLATPSPVTDGKVVCFLYGTGELFGLDAAGKTLWTHDLTKEAGRLKIMWTYGSSPLLHGGKLYVQAVHSGPSFLMALDPTTGNVLWKQPRTTSAKGEPQQAYSTPIPFTVGGSTGILVAGADALTCHDPAGGRELWRYEQKTGRLVSSPAPMGELICVGRAGRPLFAVRVSGGQVGDAWPKADAKPDVPSPTLYKGLLYVVDDKVTCLYCLEPASGATVWREELPRGTHWASATAGDGKVYCIGVNGEVSVFQAGRTAKKLAAISMGEKGCLASIAIADGRLFVRTAENLYCIGPAGGGGD